MSRTRTAAACRGCIPVLACTVLLALAAPVRAAGQMSDGTLPQPPTEEDGSSTCGPPQELGGILGEGALQPGAGPSGALGVDAGAEAELAAIVRFLQRPHASPGARLTRRGFDELVGRERRLRSRLAGALVGVRRSSAEPSRKAEAYRRLERQIAAANRLRRFLASASWSTPGSDETRSCAAAGYIPG